MAILNRDSYPYIRSQRDPNASTIEHRMNQSAWVWSLRDFRDNDYWYCEIFQGNAFHVYNIETLIPSAILRKIKTDDKTFLYVCNSHEAFLHIVEPLYNSLVFEAGIPPNKIIIANEAADLHLEVKQFADANNVGYMNVEWILEFEASCAGESRNNGLQHENVLQDHKTYEKRFLNFNRRWRLHRPALVALMKAYGILDKGYVSLAPTDDARTWKEMIPTILNYHKRDSEIVERINSVEAELLNMPPLYLDTDELFTNRPHIESSTNYLYENSLVSVVSETTFYTDQFFDGARFLSEKTFKPIAYGHPFIIVSVPKSLELLREIGYKTFHPFIDESYDQEFNDDKRMRMIINEIVKIANMSDSEVKEFIENVKEITTHNFNLIRQKATMVDNQPDPMALKKNFIRKTL